MSSNRLSTLVKQVLSEAKPIGFVVECEDESKNAQGTIFPPTKTGWCEVVITAKKKKWEKESHRKELLIEAENLLIEMNFKKNNNKRPFNWDLISIELDPDFSYSTYVRHKGERK